MHKYFSWKGRALLQSCTPHINFNILYIKSLKIRKLKLNMQAIAKYFLGFSPTGIAVS